MLGLFWVFTDLVLDYGVLGWIMFAIVFIPLYAIGEELSDRVLSVEAGQHISDQSFSWKRIAIGLVLVIEGVIWAAVPGQARRLLEAHGVSPEGLDTVVLIERGRVYTRSTAALRVTPAARRS